MAKETKHTIPRQKSKTNAYLIGGGIGSLAAAVYLIRDAGVPGKNIHIFENLKVAGGSMDGSGTHKSGYMIRGGRMFNIPTYECLQELTSTIPSIEYADDISMEQEFLEYNAEFKTMARARLVDKNGKKVDVTHMGFNADDRLRMEKLVLIDGEEKLGNTKINQYFSKHFFKTNFWYMWQTTFAFQPWSSVVELKRYMLRFMHEFIRIHTLEGVARSQYNQYDSIILPMRIWLESMGVTFDYSARATDMTFGEYNDMRVVTEIVFDHMGHREVIKVLPTDIVTFTNGSMTDNSAEGSTTTVAQYNKDTNIPSFSLWKKIARGRPELGKPDVFCGKPDESMWMSFTTTINDNPELFDYIQRFTRNHPGGGALVTFKDSAWLLSIVVARQPHFKNQPLSTQIFWGYSLNMFANGDYVKKPMYKCTGAEIMTELMGHLHIPKRDQARMMKHVICRTAIMPYITSQFQPRKPGDRPNVVPDGYGNLAFISQFAEQPDDVVFTVEYSVRAAQRAIYHLMNVNKKLIPVSKHQYEPRVLLKSFLKLHS